MKRTSDKIQRITQSQSCRPDSENLAQLEAMCTGSGVFVLFFTTAGFGGRLRS